LRGFRSLAQQKLISKQRYGAKVTKKHDEPATPHQRTVRHPRMRKSPVIRMNAAFKRLKPGALSRQILAFTAELETLALAKKPAPIRPTPDLETLGFRSLSTEATITRRRKFSFEATY
jgi:hypothetical protein